MNIRKIFGQAVLSASLLAGGAVAVNAAENASVPQGTPCQVYEKSAFRPEDTQNYFTDRIFDYDVGALLFRGRGGFGDPLTAVPFSALDDQGKKKVKEMQKQLPAACKSKLGLK